MNLPTPSWPPRDADHLLVSGAQMAALEQQLFASGLPVEALMEKAALAVAQVLQRDWTTLLQRHGALVLVGPGHNGGDGLVIARELHLAGIRTSLWSPFAQHKPLTAAHLSHARWLGIDERLEPPDPGAAELWIDALFGVGQNRPLPKPLAELLRQRQHCRPGALVAVDTPSGIDDSSGQRLGETCAVAATTYCIGLIKQGLVQDPALSAVGQLRRLELNLPQSLLQSLEPTTPLGLREADASRPGHPWPALDPAAGKYERGRLLLIAGSESYRGAGHLALLGASAAGLGSLRAALAAPLAQGLWQLLPHVVLQRQLRCDWAGALQLSELEAGDLDRLDALLLGPGIGASGDAEMSPEEQSAWERLQRFSGLLVLDADGLNRITAGWLRERRGPTWITPHHGEFARLWPELRGTPPLQAAMRAAADSGAAVLLKGARSVIAATDGRCWQLMEASAAAARAGLGDVLAGYVAARGAMAMASGKPCDAAWLAAAALEHAAAGLQCARQIGAGGVNPMAVAYQLCQQSQTETISRSQQSNTIKTLAP